MIIGTGMTLTGGAGSPYAGQTFNFDQLPKDFWGAPASSGSGSGSSSSSSSTSALPPSIAPPNLNEYQYSTDSQSYPTYLRNLGENQAQQQFQSQVNSIGMGNSAQNYQHAQDALNQNRLGYMSQAGQAQLGVDQSMMQARNAYNQMLAQLYGTQVSQRGQDVGYMGDLARANASMGGSRISLGGGGGSGGSTGQGAFYGLEAQNRQDSQMSIPNSSYMGGYGGGYGGGYTPSSYSPPQDYSYQVFSPDSYSSDSSYGGGYGGSDEEED